MTDQRNVPDNSRLTCIRGDRKSSIPAGVTVMVAEVWDG